MSSRVSSNRNNKEEDFHRSIDENYRDLELELERVRNEVEELERHNQQEMSEVARLWMEAMAPRQILPFSNEYDAAGIDWCLQEREDVPVGYEKSDLQIEFESIKMRPEYLKELDQLREEYDDLSERDLSIHAYVNAMEVIEQQCIDLFETRKRKFSFQ